MKKQSEIKLKDLLTKSDITRQKGTNSTSLIIGGSSMYTGAPYFTALSSLRSGIELIYIMTQKDAILSLKTLLPEAIVLEIENIEFIINRANVCVIGPGLGRIDEDLNKKMIQICQNLMQRNIYIIFDGDGIHFYKQDIHIFDKYKKIVVTPNKNEMKRLTKIEIEDVFIVEKEYIDRIHYRGKVKDIDSVKIDHRCAGQGDILCGIISFLIVNVENKKNIVDVLVFACKIMRKALFLAYNVYGNSLIASDIIKYIYDAYKEIFDT